MTSNYATPISIGNNSSNNNTKKVELLSDNIKLGKDTILTEKVYLKENLLDNYIHLDIFTGSFFTGIILIIICIVYLFKTNTEYLSLIFGLVLLVALPFTWLINFIKSSNSEYKLYSSICLFFGILFNFTAILIVILYTTRLNNNIKEYKANQVLEPESGQTPGKFHINQVIIDNSQKIKILFTTNLVLSIGIILNFFVYEGEKFKNGKTNIETNMSKNIYWWYDTIEKRITYVDNFITNIIHYIPINGFLKMFLLFCIGFLSFFFSFFVKLKTTFVDKSISDPYVQNLINEFGYGLKGIYPATNYDIVNFPNILVETAGPVDFAALSSVFLSFLVIIIFYFLYLLIKNFSFLQPLLTSVSNRFSTSANSSFSTFIIFCVFFLINFLALYYGNLSSSHKLGGNPNITSSNIISQNYILLLLCFVFSLLGTPVVFMVFELISRIFNISLASDLITLIIAKTCNTDKYCNYRAYFALGLLLISFFGLLFGIFFYGANFDGKKMGHWLSNDGNNNQIKLFAVLILSLLVGWIFALHLKFNMFSFIYQSIILSSRMILFVFAPLTLLALSITQIVIAYLSWKIVGDPVITDG